MHRAHYTLKFRKKQFEQGQSSEKNNIKKQRTCLLIKYSFIETNRMEGYLQTKRCIHNLLHLNGALVRRSKSKLCQQIHFRSILRSTFSHIFPTFWTPHSPNFHIQPFLLAYITTFVIKFFKIQDHRKHHKGVSGCQL